MKKLHQRLGLLTGVSVSAFCLAAPAAAATVPGILDQVSGESVDDQLVISGIDDAAAIYGVTAEGTALAFAIVSSPDNGEIAQVGNAFGATPIEGLLTMTATNAGVVTIEAVAHASNTAGAATARGHVERAVTQNGLATGKSALTLDNSGSLAIDAAAQATGTSAVALATMSTGILQNAAGPIANIALSNEGEIEISAIAGAFAADGAAMASANVMGIKQHAFATDSGTVSLTNDGTIEIAAGAIASGFGTAEADAQVRAGVFQSATGMDSVDGFAGVSLGNDGTLDISAMASAIAQANAAADANIVTAIYQHATGSAGGAQATLTNSGGMTFAAGAHAVAHNDGSRPAVATASAVAGGINQQAIAKTASNFSGTSSGTFHFSRSVTPHGPASIVLDISGSISLLAAATATGDDGALANAAVTVLLQVAQGSDATVELTNSGDLSASATGHASGGHAATAFAFASGIHQTASAHSSQSSVTIASNGSGHAGQLFGGVGPADVSLSNSGSITLAAEAQAIAGTESAVGGSTTFAAAQAHIGVGILQQAFGSDAHASVTNEGSIALTGLAKATAAGNALAQADVNGFSQVAIATAFIRSANFTASGFSGFSGSAYVGPAVDEFVNSGVFEVAAIGHAEALGSAQANLHATGGLQLANGDTASVLFQNSGSFAVHASGEANGAGEFVFAAALGLSQFEKGLESASEQIVNSGTMTIAAHAHGTATQGVAWDFAGAAGFVQAPLSLATATPSLANSGTIKVVAEAQATGATLANASASAAGLLQTPLFGNLKTQFSNEGTLSVLAAAAASAQEGPAYASARATGLFVDSGHITADVVNGGSMTVAASAAADGISGSAYAYAGGISMLAANHMSSTTVSAGTLDGSIVNSGELNVSAKVDSANSGTIGATATGIYLSSTRNSATVVNSGSISVDAVTGHGAPATAYGVHVVTAERGDAATADDLFTFTNDGGDIVVRQSVDGGASWQRGMAIDVSAAPNASVVNLLGDGSIYGNVAIQASDEINVALGTTYFDGIINPSFVPDAGISGADLDSGLAGVGTLNVANGGNLVLADPRLSGNAAMYDGPAYVLVDTLNVASDGALTFELQPASSGLQAPGTYAQLFANQANLDGKLVANVTTANGLFADSYSWQNVIDGNAMGGMFDQCGLGGAHAGSVLLQFSCSYDSNDNVDLALKRNAFDSVAGLNANGSSVGSGLEGVYGTSLTGGAASLFRDLFLITDPADYKLALNALSGSAYANYLQSFASLGVHYDDLIDNVTDCGAEAVRGSALDCRGGPVRVWGQLDYQRRKSDGDSEAGAMTSNRFTGQLGVDASVADSAILGVTAGRVTNHSRDRQFGDSIDAAGMQVGAYAAFDPGIFFAKAVTTYSWYDGKSRRHIDFAPLGGTFQGNPTGEPDATLWSAGLHAGARVPLGASVATPYFNVDYIQARLKGFTETGAEGANLTVEGSHSDHTYLTGGVKWAAHLGGVAPELNVGYRYRLGDSRSSFAAAFLGDTSSDFDIVSASQKRGGLLAGVSIGGKLGPVDLRIGYEGEFNGDVMSHSGQFKLVLPLGRHHAPAAVAPRH